MNDFLTVQNNIELGQNLVL